MHKRSMQYRIIAALALAPVAMAAFAQQTAAGVPSAAMADKTLIHVLVGLAGLQAIIIAALSAIMANLAGPDGWLQKLGRGGKAVALAPLLLLAAPAKAQAYIPDTGPNDNTTFWWLVAVNVFLFLVLFTQLSWLRTLTAAARPQEALAPEVKKARAQAWWEALRHKLTRQVKLEDEERIVLEHDYDGIKELDNDLPPWWLWLFYATVAWGVVYIVNVHVIKVWPQQDVEYANEMQRAKENVAAYLATQTNLVDETNVTFTDEAGVIAEGRTLYATYCTACHGADAAGSENSVGPNLTDAHWLHGGGIKNIFHTIKYGVPEKGMIAWKSQLQPSEIRAIASYIITQEGKGGPDQKGPQGEIWKGEEAGDATSAGADSDTLRISMK